MRLQPGPSAVSSMHRGPRASSARLNQASSARYSRQHVGSDSIGWLHFQTIYDQIAQTQPDLFR